MDLFDVKKDYFKQDKTWRDLYTNNKITKDEFDLLAEFDNIEGENMHFKFQVFKKVRERIILNFILLVCFFGTDSLFISASYGIHEDICQNNAQKNHLLYVTASAAYVFLILFNFFLSLFLFMLFSYTFFYSVARK